MLVNTITAGDREQSAIAALSKAAMWGRRLYYFKAGLP
jgi:hypothetical protein